jgi:ankyrin repeat protein
VLIQAIKERDVERVRDLLHDGASLNEVAPSDTLWWPSDPPEDVFKSGVDPIGWRPLHVAAWAGDAEIVRLLIERGADPNRATRIGWTPALIAGTCGNLDAVRELVAAGAVVTGVDDKLGSPLEAASFRGHVETVKFLLDAGADPNASRASGRSPLVAAAIGKHAAVVQALLSAGANPLAIDREGWTARMHAVWFRATEATALLNVSPGSAHLRDAAASGSATEVDDALVAGESTTSADGFGHSPLAWACLAGSVPAVERLAAAGADLTAPDDIGRKPIDFAASRGHARVVEYLHHATRDPGRALAAAADAAQPVVVRLLLQRGVPPDAEALVDAARSDSAEVVSLLVDAGLPVDARNAAGYTALHCAAALGHEDLARDLLTLGADRGVRDRDGRTAGEIAGEEGWDELAALLARS